MNFTSIVNQLAKNGKIVSQVQAKLQPVIAKATGTAATILPPSAVRLKESVDVLNAGKTVVTAIVNDVAAGHSISALAKTTADFDTNWDKFAKEVEDVFNATSLQGQGKVLETFAKTEFGPNVFYAGSAIKNEVPNVLGGISDFQGAVNGFGGSYRDPVAAAKKIKNGVDGIVNATERVANSLNQMVKTYKGQGNPNNIAGYPLLNQIGNLHNNKLLQSVENAMRIGGGVAAVGVGGMNVAADLKKGDFVQAGKDAKQTFDNFKSLTKNNMGSGATPKVQNSAQTSSTATGSAANTFGPTVSQQSTPSTPLTPSASMGGTPSSAPTPPPSAVTNPSSSAPSSLLNPTSKTSSTSSSASFENGSSPSSTNQSTSTTNNASDNQIGSSNRQQQDKNDKKDNHQDDDDDDDEKRDDDDNDGGLDNANSNSYVCSGARIKCSFGTSESQLVVYPDRTVFLTGKPMANISDHQSMYNIKPFGRCRTVAYPPTGSATAAHHGHLTPMPCVPGTFTKWEMGKNDYIVKGNPALLKTSFCQCCYGGIITLINDGQTSTGPANMSKEKRVNKSKILENQTEIDNLSVDKVLDGIQLSLDAAGFVPGFGAIPDLTNAAISALRGNWAEAGLSVLAAVPIIGDAVAGVKMAKRGVNIAKMAQKSVTKNVDVSIKGLVKHGMSVDEAKAFRRGIRNERRNVARKFYEDNTNWASEKIESHLQGIDFTKPVIVDKLPPPGKKQITVYQYRNISDEGKYLQGNYYTTNPNAMPSELGIADTYSLNKGTLPFPKEKFSGQVSEELPCLRSTAKRIDDTWSMHGQSIPTKGGAEQIFIPNQVNLSNIKKM